MIKKKVLSLLLSALLVLMVVAVSFKFSLVYATGSSFSEVHIDFGLDASPVQSGFIGLGDTNGFNASIGYGWMTEANVSTNLPPVDRGAIGGDSYSDLHRDLQWTGACTRFFLVSVNTTAEYNWTWHYGDLSYSGGPFDLWVQGIEVYTTLSYTAGVFHNVTGSAVATAGTLFNFTVVLSANSGFNGVELEAETPAYYTQFDMGTSSSPVQSGWHQVTGSDIYNVSVNHHGWNASLSDIDRVNETDLARDGCWGGAAGPRMFTIDVTYSGTFNMEVLHWNDGYANAGFYITAQGEYVVQNMTFDYNADPYWMNFSLFCISGQIELVFGSTSDNWIVNGVNVTYISTFYDTFGDLSHWTTYVDTPFVSIVNQTGSSGLQFNTSQTWVGDQSFGGEMLNGTKYTTMPALYLSDPNTSTFSNGTIEFDLHTPVEWSGSGGNDFTVGLTFRMQNDSSYYAWIMQWRTANGRGIPPESNGGQWAFHKYNKLDNTTWPWTYISPNLATPLSLNSTYHIMITMNGSQFLATFKYTSGFIVTLVGTDSTWSQGSWGGIGLYLLYSPVNPLWIDNFAYSPIVAYGRSSHPISYFTDEVLVHAGLRANWFTTQFLFDFYEAYITPIFIFGDTFITEATNYMGINFTTGYLVNYTNPQNGHIGIEISGGGLGAFCSSGNGPYRPVFSPDEDYPYIGLGIACFTGSYGGSWIGHNVTGYYAYLFIAHELMNTFNWFGSVNVPGWAADGKSPFPYEFKTIPMDLAGDVIGGAQGTDISAIAIFEEKWPRDPGYYYGGSYWIDTGVYMLHKWISDYPNFYQNAMAAFREDKVGFGWTIYGNETGGYPIITDYNLRSAYFQIYINYGAGVHDLNWTWGNFVYTGTLYIPTSENNQTLRNILTSIHNVLVNVRNYTIQWQLLGNNVTGINANMSIAWEYWRKGYYEAANAIALPIYGDLMRDLGIIGGLVPTSTFYISPIYIFFGKVADILGCLGAVAVVYSKVKDIKSGLKGFVIIMIILFIFFILWYAMSTLEAFA